MITIPASPRPNRLTVEYLDFGFYQETIGASVRVDRPGNRHRLTMTWPRELMVPGTREVFTAALKRGKRQGVQINVPLTSAQGNPGSPVVNGAGQTGTTLVIRGLTVGYDLRQDYWLSIAKADGTSYLHSVFIGAVANASGIATIQIEPALRAPFPDGAAIQLQNPVIQGLLVGETFSYDVEEMKMTPLSITVQEFE